MGTMSWSPDSRWMAYEKNAPNTFTQIKLFRPEDGIRADLTSDRVNSFSPAWDPDGRFLYFLSDRNLVSLVGGPWGVPAPEPFFDRTNEIFVVSLRSGLRSPFTPDDELTKSDSAVGNAGGGSAAGGAAGWAKRWSVQPSRGKGVGQRRACPRRDRATGSHGSGQAGAGPGRQLSGPDGK